MLVSLGLSLLASLCRLPEVPASDEMQRLLPSLATVVSAGSVSAALRDPPISHPTSDQTTHTHAPTHPAPESPDWGALSDALECLLAAATNQSGPASSAACEQLLQLGLVGSVGRVLQGVLATSAQHRWQGVGADGRGGSPWRMMVMAVRLLSTLLATAPPQQATDKEPGKHNTCHSCSLVHCTHTATCGDPHMQELSKLCYVTRCSQAGVVAVYD